MQRWWTYQAERFPLFAHGPLVLAFSTSAVCFSWMLHGTGDGPGIAGFIVAFVSCLTFFLQLRIADEFKDFEEDLRYRPYRPVQRGLVTLRELAVLFAIGGALQLAMALWYETRLLLPLLVTWIYLAAMSKEFFVRAWLEGKHLFYMVSHMVIMPLIDFYATSSEWARSLGRPPEGLEWFLLASFFNGMVIEIGRKIRREQDEEDGVATYSAVWGRTRAVMSFWLVMVLTGICAGLAAMRIDFGWVLVPALCFTLLLTIVLGVRFLRASEASRGSGKLFEHLSGAWTLVLYLGLGLVPYFLRQAGVTG
jgi:4-hydroxybenzoate polyprenyltransferase